MELQYVNKKGNTVKVAVTRHALVRFSERWNRAFPKKAITTIGETQVNLMNVFGEAKRFEPKGGHYERRMKRHGKDTVYFRTDTFVFVIQASTLITVELHGKEMRPMNKPYGLSKIMAEHLNIESEQEYA